jgi:hypothetical protein
MLEHGGFFVCSRNFAPMRCSVAAPGTRASGSRQEFTGSPFPGEKEHFPMTTQQGSLELLQDPVAQRLLTGPYLARVAYTWTDGTPRVIPIWFHWDGKEIVLGSPVGAPKALALMHNPKVALTIEDDRQWPFKVLLIRGTAAVTTVDGMVPEYAWSAERYFGPEQGKGWVEQVSKLSPQMVRVAITPEWVGILDFEQRFPSALERAMARAQGA